MNKKILTKEEIIRVLDEHKIELRKKFTVMKIGLFGSYTKGEQDENSDIDFVVEFKNPSLDNYTGLEVYLENLFNRKVDILTPMGVESIRVKKVYDDIIGSLIYV